MSGSWSWSCKIWSRCWSCKIWSEVVGVARSGVGEGINPNKPGIPVGAGVDSGVGKSSEPGVGVSGKPLEPGVGVSGKPLRNLVLGS